MEEGGYIYKGLATHSAIVRARKGEWRLEVGGGRLKSCCCYHSYAYHHSPVGHYGGMHACSAYLITEPQRSHNEHKTAGERRRGCTHKRVQSTKVAGAGAGGTVDDVVV